MTYIPGPFLHADMNTDMHTFLEGIIVELIAKVEYITYRKCIQKKAANQFYI